jgi:dTDP-glucose 4,6-dehydratase
METNIIGTYTLIEAARKHNKRFHHISTDEVYGDLELDDPERFTEQTPYNPSQPVLLHQGRLGPPGPRLGALLRRAGHHQQLLEQLRSVPARREVHPAPDHQRDRRHPPEAVRPGENVRDWIHADDHSSAVLPSSPRVEIGETYLIGADGEKNNKDVVELILKHMGQAPDAYDHVVDRAGHDLRYAIDSTKLRDELGWEPQFSNFEAGIEDAIAWYRNNEDWWRPQKASTEAKYKEQGQ